MNAQLSAARARTSEAKARLDQVESVLHSKTPIGAFPEAVQSQTITMLRSQYAEIMRRDAEQKSSLGERHPAVIEIEAQGARLQKLIEDEVNRIAQSDRAEYERAKADEDMLSRQVDALKNTAVSTNELLVGLRELERDVQASRAVYELFLVRSRETGEQELVDTKNIRIISKADRPLHRSSPPPSLVIGLAAMLLGFASGVGIVIMQGATEDAAPQPAKAASKDAEKFRQTGRVGQKIMGAARAAARHSRAGDPAQCRYRVRLGRGGRSAFAFRPRNPESVRSRARRPQKARQPERSRRYRRR